MNIAELFVSLGIKGADKTIDTLGNVKKGMGELGSSSLEAKAAILGALYGLERMMAMSGQTGTSLTNFTAITGKSAQDLQRLQYAAIQAGGSADELTGSFRGVQNAMSDLLLKHKAPEGIAFVSQALQSVGQKLDPAKYKDTLYVFGQLQTAMQKMSPELAQMAGKSFGLSDNTIAQMRRNAFTPEIMNKAPRYSDREIGSLTKADAAWKTLGLNIEMAFGHFNAKHGNELVGDITKILPHVTKLVEAFVKLAEAIQVFQLLGKVFDGWGLIFDKLTNIVNGLGKETKGGDSAWQTTKDFAKFLFTDPKEYGGKSLDDPIVPKVAKGGGGSSTTNHTTVNQTFHNVDHKDQNAVGQLHKKAVKQAVGESYNQRRGVTYQGG